MMNGPDTFETSVRFPSPATGTFRRFWVCDEHVVARRQFREHQGRLYGWRPEDAS
jgi:hypothetical protein